MYDFQGMNDYSDIFLSKNSFHLIRLSKPSMILYLLFVQFMFMMVIWIFRISTATWNYTSFISTGIISVNVIYVALIVKTFFSDCVGKLYTADGISFFHRLSGKQLMMLFSWKMELRSQVQISRTNASPLLSKWICMIYFGGFYLFIWFLYIYSK